MNPPGPLEAVIDNFIVPDNFGQRSGLDLKIELLGFIMEKLKQQRRFKEGQLTFE